MTTHRLTREEAINEAGELTVEHLEGLTCHRTERDTSDGEAEFMAEACIRIGSACEPIARIRAYYYADIDLVAEGRIHDWIRTEYEIL